ncbi:MAG: hypothetical protein JWN04_3957 [Myxococcaceae bacterium]|nr:hypothetical protein [Myxococcaceae bacterium]
MGDRLAKRVFGRASEEPGRSAGPVLGLVAAFVLGACGGNVSDKDGQGALDAGVQTDSGHDGPHGEGGPGTGTPMSDAGLDAMVNGTDGRVDMVPTTPRDSGTVGGGGPDASTDELAVALSSAGVETSVHRAVLVFAAACQRAAECEAPARPDPACASDDLNMYQGQIAAGIAAACLDAMLDFYGCATLEPTCDGFLAGCPTAGAAYSAACSP